VAKRHDADQPAPVRRDTSERPGPSESSGANESPEPTERTAAKGEPIHRVSRHRVPPARSTLTADLPEHDWNAARERVFPLLQPAGTLGIPLERLRDAPLPSPSGSAHAEPVVARGPCGLAIVFGMQAAGFDVLVNLEHLGAWGIGAKSLEQTAAENLAAWSDRTGWTDESSGDRRLLSSDSGEGYDASRILLEPVRAHLAGELGAQAGARSRVLVGIPDRHLLVAGALASGDTEFVALFREFVAQQSEAAEEPIDGRIFEIAGGELVEFAT
jgi:hypothetical protein